MTANGTAAARPPLMPSSEIVVLRPIASPLPMGLFTVAAASATVAALQVGVLPAGAETAVALVLWPAAVVHLVVVVACLLARDPAAATVMAALGALWAIEAGLYGLAPPDAVPVLGLVSAFLAVFAAFAATLARTRRALSVVLSIAVVRLSLGAAAGFAGTAALTVAAGVAGFVMSAAAATAAGAFLMEDIGRTVALIGRRGPAAAAVSVTGPEREAGVRRTL